MAYEGPHPFPVKSGGTGDASFTAYSVITGGTTSTGALQNVSGVGSAGEVLTSNGAAALPTWQSAGAGSGSAKAWALATYNAGTPTILASFNVSTITWNVSGYYVVTLTSGFSSTDYVVVALPYSTTLTNLATSFNSSITSSTVFNLIVSTGTQAASAGIAFACFGT